MENNPQEPVYYQPPASHDRHVKTMVLWLSAFFGTLVIAAALFIAFADKLVVFLPFSFEKQFIKPYETMLAWVYDDPKDEDEALVEDYVQKLAGELAGHMEVPESCVIDVHFLNVDIVNAFATLGGHVFVCRGLVEAMPDENSLSMVLAHEVAHIKNRDPVVGLSRGMALQMLISFITGRGSQADYAGYGGSIGLQYFSREQERLADHEAMEALYLKYGHVHGYDEIFKHVLNLTGGDEEDLLPSNWFSSHPELAERIQYLSDKRARNQWPVQAGSPIPEDVQRVVRDMDEAENAVRLKAWLGG